jgi:hypothetical protein
MNHLFFGVSLLASERQAKEYPVFGKCAMYAVDM